MGYYDQLGVGFQSPLLQGLLAESVAQGQSSPQSSGIRAALSRKGSPRIASPSRTSGKSYDEMNQKEREAEQTRLRKLRETKGVDEANENKENPYALDQTGWADNNFSNEPIAHKYSQEDVDGFIKYYREEEGLSEVDAKKAAFNAGQIVGHTYEAPPEYSYRAPRSLHQTYSQDMFGNEASRVSYEKENKYNESKNYKYGADYGNKKYDPGEGFVDSNKNQRWDIGEQFFDYDTGGKQFNQKGANIDMGRAERGQYSLAYMPPEELSNITDSDINIEELGQGAALGSSPLGTIFEKGVYLSGKKNEPLFLSGDPEKDKELSESLNWITQEDSEAGRKFVPWEDLQEHLGEEEYQSLLDEAMQGKYGKKQGYKQTWDTEDYLDVEDFVYGAGYTPSEGLVSNRLTGENFEGRKSDYYNQLINSLNKK